jgi:hypothetical protein
MSAPPVRREHGRIYFGEGPSQWSITDLEVNDESRTDAQRDMMARHVAEEMRYLTHQCPTTALAVKKLRLIRAVYDGRVQCKAKP